MLMKKRVVPVPVPLAALGAGGARGVALVAALLCEHGGLRNVFLLLETSHLPIYRRHIEDILALRTITGVGVGVLVSIRWNRIFIKVHKSYSNTSG